MATDIIHRGPSVIECGAMILAFAVISALGFGFVVSMILTCVVTWYVRTRLTPQGAGPWIE